MSDIIIEDFVRKVRNFSHLVFYGAGDYAEMYYSILQRLGFYPEKIVVTSKTNDFFHDIPVFSYNEVILNGNEIVIGAYFDASVEEIKDKLGLNIEVVVLSSNDLFCLYNEFVFNQVLDSFTNMIKVKKECPPFREYKSILIIRLDALGDLVMTTAFIRELRYNCPKAKISLVIRPSNMSLFENCPYIDKLLLYECPSMRGTLSSQVRTHKDIKLRVERFIETGGIENSYDVVYLPRELLQGRSCYEEFLLALSIHAENRIGRIRAFEYDQKVLEDHLNRLFVLVRQNSIEHEVEYMLDLIRENGGEIQNDRLEVWGDKRLPDDIACKLESGNRYIILGISASNPNRTWPMERYIELIRLMNDNSGTYKFLLVGESLIDESSTKIAACDNVIDFTGKTSLSVLVSIMKKAVLYIGSNTGLMHIAAALRLPCVTIYATLPDIKKTNGNSSFRMGAWRTKHVDVQPVRALDDCSEMCKRPYAHCITQISADNVYKAAMSLL